MEESIVLPLRRNEHERKAAAVYVGALRYGSFQSVFDVLRHCMSLNFFFRRRGVLPAGHGSDDIRVFQDVFQEREQALPGESMVSKERDESQELFPEVEERISHKKRAGTAKKLSYL